MELQQALITRRSIRRYSDKTIDDTLVKNIIKAGMYAPSAVNKQPWHFITFTSKQSKQQIIDVHPSSKMLNESKANILICFDENLQHDEGYGPIDCSAATQNMLLCAHDLGIGACWIGIYPRPVRIGALKEIFELPVNIIPFAVIALGYPAEEKTIPDRYKPERIHSEKW